jgi:hypothetical protein
VQQSRQPLHPLATALTAAPWASPPPPKNYCLFNTVPGNPLVGGALSPRSGLWRTDKAALGDWRP